MLNLGSEVQIRTDAKKMFGLAVSERLFHESRTSESYIIKQKTAYEIASCLVGSEMCIRDSHTVN